MHNIGKVYVNASILYKNQEMCNKTSLWKFQLSSLFLLRENGKNAFSIFVFILMAGVFVSRQKLIIGSYFTNYSKTITHRAEIFQGKLSTIVIFIPCKLCVNLFVFGLTNVVQGLHVPRTNTRDGFAVFLFLRLCSSEHAYMTL